VELNPDGSLLYTPDPEFFGEDFFTYVANDGQLDSNVATVKVIVFAVEDPPVAQDRSCQMLEDTTLIIPAPGILGTSTDVDGDPLQAILVTSPESGQLTLKDDGSFIYVPEPDYFGEVNFTFKVSDGKAESNIATVTIAVESSVDGLLDVKPGSHPNSINLNSNGVLPVAVLTTSADDGEPEDFDATSILTNTIALNDIAIDPVHYAYEDVDGDGDTDLMLDFSMEDIVHDGVLDVTSVDLMLSADIRGASVLSPDFMASDSVRIVNGNGVGNLSSSGAFSSLGNYDVNGDGHLSPLDALLVIRDVNERESDPELDVTGEGYDSPLDALMVIRLLNTPVVNQDLRPLFSDSEATEDAAKDGQSNEDTLWQYGIWLKDEDEVLRWAESN
jgi:hypothetical protein